MSPLEVVLAKLPDARRDGPGFKARCPAHEDHNPSLNVTEAEDGKVLLRCWSGCSTESIVEAMGLTMRDLFPESDRQRLATQPKTTKPKPTFPTVEAALADYERHLGPRAATWNYHDQHGNQIGVVARWNKADGKKDIRPVSLNCTGWKQEGMTEPRPLYRLPEVLTTTGRIYIAEGEQCVDDFRSIGLVATTSPHGAQSADKADWTVLAGIAEIVINPDDDPAGEKYAADVIAQVSKLTPRPTIKILRLAGLPAGGDIHDWLEDRDAIEPDALRQTIEALADEAETVGGGDTTPENSEKIEVVSPSPLSPLEIFRPFPVETLPKLVGQVVHRVSKAMGCDPSFVAVPALAVLAGAIGNSRRIRLKHGWTEPAIVWTGIVGESGTLKSPPLEWLTQTLRDREETALERHAATMEDFEAEKMRHDAAVTEWKRKKSTEPPPRSLAVPVAERRLTSDATVESICSLLADNPRGMILVRDELAGWVAAFDQYKSQGGSDAAHWLSIHSAKGFAVDRKTGDRRTLFVPRPAMSVTGGIQPATLRRVLAAGHIESGLAARLLFTYPPRQAKRWTEAEISPDLEATYKRLIDGLFALEPQIEEDGKPKPLILGLSPAAKSDWVTFYNEHAAEQAELSGDLAAAWSKLECYAARLALVVHCVRVVTRDLSLTSPDVIDEASIGAGVVLSRWFGHEAKRVYSMLAETEGEREQRQLVEWITTRGGTATARELQRGPRRFRNATAEYAESELNKLVKSGQGVWEPIETTPAGGAPSRQFRLREGGDWRHNPPNPAEDRGCVARHAAEAVA